MRKFVATLIVVLVASAHCLSQDAIYLADVEGHDPTDPNAIVAGFPLTFTFNFRVESGDLTGCTNGRVVYSPDGATWQPVIQNTNPLLTSFLDGGIFTSYFSVTGSGRDTVGFGAFSLFFGGVPQGYDGYVSTLETMVSVDDIGKTLCIDSSFYPASGQWLWNTTGGAALPAWDGPHCYTIVDCCSGSRGDFDYSGMIDVADLTAFIGWLHQGGAPTVCVDEGNIDGIDAGGIPINTADLSYLVSYLFRGGPPPPPCP